MQINAPSRSSASSLQPSSTPAAEPRPGRVLQELMPSLPACPSSSLAPALPFKHFPPCREPEPCVWLSSGPG